MGIRTYGTMAVDWEQRTDFDRLRRERLARATEHLERSDLGALLCFDMTNIRYITATHIGTWAIDKLIRFCLLPQGDEPIMWDFGSAARHHKLYNPWLGEDRSRAGISTLRGAVKGRAESVAEKIRVELELRGLMNDPVGVDVIELPVLFALQQAGITVADGQALMQDVRKIKTEDEITLLNTACAMVDAAYDDLFRAMKPGFRENDCVALVNKVLFELGSEHVEGVNAISGERCSPHPHVFTDRMLRPGRPRVLRHPPRVQRLPHVLLPHVRRRLRVARARRRVRALPRHPRPRDLDGAAGRHDGGHRRDLPARRGVRVPRRGGGLRAPVRARRRALDLGEADLQPPRLVRLSGDDRGGMVFALETFWPSSDGWSAARIEEQLVVTKDGCEVITRFPAEELLVTAGGQYTVAGGLPGQRETTSNLNNPRLVDAVVGSAAYEGTNAV